LGSRGYRATKALTPARFPGRGSMRSLRGGTCGNLAGHTDAPLPAPRGRRDRRGASEHDNAGARLHGRGRSSASAAQGTGRRVSTGRLDLDTKKTAGSRPIGEPRGNVRTQKSNTSTTSRLPHMVQDARGIAPGGREERRRGQRNLFYLATSPITPVFRASAWMRGLRVDATIEVHLPS